MKFDFKDTALKNMTHNTSIQNQHFSILCLILAEISMKFYSKDTSFRDMSHKTLQFRIKILQICSYC